MAGEEYELVCSLADLVDAGSNQRVEALLISSMDSWDA